MSRKSSKSTPILMSGVLYTDDEFNGVEIDSQRWREFLDADLGGKRSFYYDGSDVQFTARREKRGKGFFWYAYRKHRGELQNRYIGRPGDVTANRLREVAASYENTQRDLKDKESRS